MLNTIFIHNIIIIIIMVLFYLFIQYYAVLKEITHNSRLSLNYYILSIRHLSYSYVIVINYDIHCCIATLIINVSKN